MQVTSTFWAAIHSLPRAELAIIPTMKEEIQGYHMNPNYKKLVHPIQRNLRCHVVATVFLADGTPLQPPNLIASKQTAKVALIDAIKISG